MSPYRSDVVGSLLRPAYLSGARVEFAAGRITPAEFKRAEDRAVDEAIALQETAGLDVISDGEMRRTTFYDHLIDSIDGFDRHGGWTIPFRDESGEELQHERPIVVGKLQWKRSMCGEEFTYLRARARRATKATLPSAYQTAAYYDREKSKSVYPTRDAYFADITDILRREVEELVRLGCTYIQVDGPQYAALLDPEFRESFRKRGGDPERTLDAMIALENAVIGNHPGITFGLHICRGNNRSKYLASGAYDPIAAKVFGKTRFRRFLLEYDDDRSGSFEPLKHVPDDRVVVLGLVTTKKPAVESGEELKQRIHEAQKYVPLERLALSPQCGFASTWEGNRISPDVQRRKLELVAGVAREVWG